MSLEGEREIPAVTVDEALAVLNRALANDPDCLNALMVLEVECNDAMGDDPTIQVGPSFVGDEPLVLRFLGLLNGIFGVDERGIGHLAMCWDDDPKRLARFMRTHRARQ